MGLHVAMIRAPHRELRLILLGGAIGAFWDSFLVAMGWLHYPSGTFMAGMAPHWIIALWMLFACTPSKQNTYPTSMVGLSFS
ncbi:DUF2878 family protein [Nitrosococcus wardiae]